MDIDLVYVLAKFLHDVATVVWIGGLFVMGIVILPSIKKGLPKGAETKHFKKILQDRMRKIIYISILVLFLTGLPLARNSGQFLGLISLGNEYSTLTTIKHILYGGMIVIMLTRSQVLGRLNLEPRKQEKLSMLLLFFNILLAIVVLFLSSLLVGVAN